MGAFYALGFHLVAAIAVAERPNFVYVTNRVADEAAMINLKEIGKNWEKYAQTDPLWAILSNQAKKGNKWDLGEFFESGRRTIDAEMKYLAELHI